MKKRFRRVRGGFIPPTPFYKKYRSQATKRSWRTVPLTRPTGRPLTIPGIGKSPVRVTPITRRPPKTQPKPQVAPKQTVKQTQQDEMRKTRRRWGVRFGPPRMKKRPNMMGRRRKGGTPMTKVRPTGEGATNSFYMRYRPLRKKLNGIDRMSVEQVKVRPVFGRYTQVSGRQAVWEEPVGEVVDLVSMLNSMPTYPNFPPGNRSLYVKSMTQKYTITNTASTNVFIDLYQVEPRDDMPDFPVDAFNAGIGDVTANSEGSGSLGVSPYQSLQFTSNFIIKKKYTIELAPGRTHVHTAKYNIGKLLSQAEINFSPTTFKRGYSHFLMMVAVGEPVNTKPNEQFAVTSSPVSINTYSLETFRYHFASPVTKNMVYSPLNAYQIDNPSLQNYDEGSGSVEDVTAA